MSSRARGEHALVRSVSQARILAHRKTCMNRRTFGKGVLAAAVGGSMKMSQRSNAPSTGDGFITDVDGIKVGHFTDSRRPTGCTVLLCEAGAVAGVDVRGSAPGTRETDLLDPIN